MPKDKKRTVRLGRGLSSLMGHPVRVDPRTADTESVAAQVLATAPLAETAAVSDEDATAGAAELSYLPVDSISPNPHQPRELFAEPSLQRLATSIRADGLMQPIVVRPASDSTFELVTGERRWRAARIAGLDQIPAIVRELDDQQLAEWSLIENLQREDLNPIERAEAFQHLAERFGLSPSRIAERVGMDRTSISNLLRLLKLSKEVQQLVRQNLLSMGQARAIAGIDDPDQQLLIADQAVRQAMSVRQVEQATRKAVAGTPAGSDPRGQGTAKRRAAPGSAYLKDLEQQIGQQLSTRVRIQPGRKKGAGKLSIDFFTLDQFDELLSRLGVETE